MRENKLGELIKTIEKDIKPPAGLRSKMLTEITQSYKGDGFQYLSPIEKFIFERPLRAACALSVAISSFLWALLGSGYPNILLSFAGKR